ncbi:hypothetical protein O181_047491 [Austropuccinia psidii MF-1]|uniref:Integrase catalytic domain-containing protein n=1 Tax=Austropuccinia psidii MF-1 TaxID=1389203 RepID=A0A9Q3HJJ4_9BASI|nr:hypothetical protein [Austropuccinia psidii MF-1]
MNIEIRARRLYTVCTNKVPENSTPEALEKWNLANNEAVSLISNKLHHNVFISIVNPQTVCSTNSLWTKIHSKFAPQTFVNKGRVWLQWECLKFNGNIKEYIENFQTLLLDISSIGIVIPNKILAYSILGKINSDGQTPRGYKSPENKRYWVLQKRNQYLKDNPRNTTHKESSCWVEHPDLQPPSNCNRKKFNRQDSDSATHQTGMSALLTSKALIPDINNTLVVNCSATHHMCNNKELFSKSVETEKLNISTSDPGSNLFATGRGTIAIEVENETVLLPNCLYVPNLSRNLISLLKIFATSITIAKHDKVFSITNNNKTILHGKISNNLMVSNFTKCTTLLTTGRGTQPCWHLRLGHPRNQTLKLMGLPTFEKDHCNVCTKGKMTLKPFKSHFEVVEQPLDCLHLDLVGPIFPPSISGYCYFLTRVDQCTSFKIVKFLKNKSDALQEFKIVKNMIETDHDAKIKEIVSDRGGEFINLEFKQLANKSGFIHVTSPPYTSQLDGFAERANRAILKKALCLLLGTNIPKKYWAEAVNNSTLLINLIPTPSRNNQSPLYHWTGNAPRIKCICKFGCKVVFVENNDQDRPDRKPATFKTLTATPPQ